MLYHAPPRDSRRQQSGYATLFIGLSLFFMAALITGFLAKTGLSDIKSAADKTRYSQALAAAESNMEVTLGWMRFQSSAALAPAAWALCTDTDSDDPVYQRYVGSAEWDGLFATSRCREVEIVNGGVTHRAYIAALQNAGNWTYTLVGAGTSDDESASAVVKQGVRYMFETVGEQPAPPPIMGAGAIELKGSFNVVANPNAGGQGVPVSVWTRSTTEDSNGNWSSCQIDEYRTYGDSCDTKPLSSKGNINADIIANDPTFPNDMFKYLFGVTQNMYETVKFNPNTTTVLPSCNTLAAATAALTESRIFWITGDCDIGGNIIPPAPAAGANPIQIAVVVEDGNYKINAGNTMQGLLFMFSPDGTTGEIQSNGNATIIGSIASNNNNILGLNTNGTFNLIYSNDVWRGIQNLLDQAIEAAKVPGTWADYLQ